MILFGIWWLQTALKQHSSERARVKELANLALRALRDQVCFPNHHITKLNASQKRHYNLNKSQGRNAGNPFWSLSGMRDHLLSAEHNLHVRQRLWKQVAKIVESNDNVRLYEVELDGQPGVRVWDWSGNVTDAFVSVISKLIKN